jgi:DNA-binding response OmpR family regulator
LLKRVNIRVEPEEQTKFALGIFIFDTENQTLVSKDDVKSLTKKEVQILKILYKYKNQVISREVILNAVWGQNDYFVGRSLDVFITKLRKYLREEPKILICNIHGVGFKFELSE